MKFVDYHQGQWRIDGDPFSGGLFAMFGRMKPLERVEKVMVWDLKETLLQLLKTERSDVTKAQIFFGKRPAYFRIKNFYFYGATNHILGNARLAEKMSRQDFVHRLLSFYSCAGVEKIHATIAATARQLWLTKFCPEYAVDPSQEPRQFCLGSMYAARNEIFTKKAFDNEVDTGRCFHYDINSAYGSIMLGDLPEPVAFTPGACLESPGVSEVVMKHPFSHWYKFGIWPSTDPAGYHSCDRATLRLPNNEIRAMMAEGFQLQKVIGGWHVRHLGWRPLESYTRFFMMLRARFKAEGKKFEYHLSKQMVNMLYGQFCQRPLKSEIFNRSEYRRLSKKTRSTTGWRSFFGEWFVRDVPGRFQPHVNVLWSAIIAGTIRERLGRVIRRVADEGQKLWYTDTDSLVYTGDKPLESIYPEVCGPDPGKWSMRNEYSFFRAVLQKYYLYRTISGDVGSVIAGLPHDRKPTDFSEMLTMTRKFA